MRLPALLSILAAAVLATGCASQPLYRGATVVATPATVAAAPEQYHGSVVWGGSIVAVHNRADHSEIEIFARPLDGGQRPRDNDIGAGRFIAIMPGYAEPMDYPAGGLITVTGDLAGVRSGRVGEAPYVFPLVRVTASHRWTEAAPRRRPDVHFGIGIGIGIR